MDPRKDLEIIPIDVSLIAPSRNFDKQSTKGFLKINLHEESDL